MNAQSRQNAIYCIGELVASDLNDPSVRYCHIITQDLVSDNIGGHVQQLLITAAKLFHPTAVCI